MLQLSRHAEVSLHAQAADMEFVVERRGQNNWQITIEGVTDISLAVGDNGLSEPQSIPRIKKTYTLTDAQASATLALFIGELEDSELNAKLYVIAEEIWKDVAPPFRLIP